MIRLPARLLLLTALALSAAGCGGAGGEGPAEPASAAAPAAPTSVSGAATKGPLLAGSTVRAFAIVAGARGGSIGTAATGQSGSFSITITDTAYSGDILLEASGNFVDEATAVTVNTGATPLRGVALGFTRGARLSGVQLTPLTDIAVNLALGRGGLTNENLRQALADVGAKFGIESPQSTVPVTPTREARASTGEPERYGLLLAGLSGEALLKGLPVLTLVAAMNADAGDGRFDGTLQGQPITLTNVRGEIVVYSAASLTTELAAGIDRFLASPGNTGGLNADDPLPATVKQPLGTANRPPLALASVFPAVVTTGEAVRLDGRGSSDPDGGTLSYRWTLRLDGSAIELFGERSPEALFVGTEPGSYTVTLTVTDGAGLASVASGRFQVNTRPPGPTPAALSLGTPSANAATVDAGQSFVLTVPVFNAGQTDARAASLAVSIPDPRIVAAARAGNPSVIPAGGSASFVFDVRTTTLAPPGSLSARLELEAVDATSRRALGDARTVTLPVLVRLPPQAPALVLSNLRAPASLSVGQSTTVSVDVTNPGTQAATITDARIAFDVPTIAGSVNPEGPREVQPGQTVQLTFTVDTRLDSLTGPRSFSVSVFAVGSASRLPLASTAPAPGLLPLSGQALLTVTTLSVTPSQVSSGTPVDISAVVTAGGSVASVVRQVRLRIGDLMLTPSPNPAPVTLAPGATITFAFRIDSSTLPKDVGMGVEAVLDATDIASGLQVPVVQPSPARVLLVQVPAALRIETFLPTPRFVSQGQRVRLQMIVGNDGSALTTETSIAITMRQTTGTDVTGQFRITPVGPAPTVIAGHTRLRYEFDVIVPAAGLLGPVTVSGVLSGRDGNSRAALVTPASTLDWILQTPADTAIGVLAIPALMSQGQTVRATFTVTNRGQATARVVTAGLGFVPSQGLAIAPRPNPLSIPGLTTVTFQFDVTSTSSTLAGTRTAQTTVTVEDVNSDDRHSRNIPDAGLLTVQIPAKLTIVSVLGDRPANLGQTDNPVTMRIRNDGQATALIQSATITAAENGFNPRRLTGLPVTLPGGTEVFLSYLVDVPAGATLGRSSLSGQAIFFDTNTAISSVVRDTGGGFILVQRRSTLATGDVLVAAPAGIDRGGLPMSLDVLIRNGTSDQATYFIDSISLAFSIGASDVSTQYTVAAPSGVTITPVAGGTTGTFTFQVSASLAATKLRGVTIAASVAAHDANDLTASASGGASSWVVRDAADAVRGQSGFTGGLRNAGGVAGAGTMALPQAVATDGVRVAVSDLGNNRVLLFASDQDVAASAVIGQPNFTSTLVTRPTSASVRAPAGLAFAGTRLLLADKGNNRVLVYDDVLALMAGETTAGLALGQADLVSGDANRTTEPVSVPDATTLNGPSDVAVSGFDVVVADTGNNRVLIYRDLFTMRTGAAAAVVLGQGDFVSNRPNRGGAVGPDTMSSPVSVAVTGSRLLVADSLNHRVLVWNDITAISSAQPADFVLGQADLTSGQPDRGTGAPSALGLNTPSSVRLAGTRLYVSDSINNRVVVYTRFPEVAASGAAPDELLGQGLFTQNSAVGVLSTRDAFSMLLPGQGAGLGSSILLLADQLNNRVLRIPLP
ncbi:MAG: PKD domain-containing protein [Candidatus Wallbacteria bacterium]|nr:PKD domain-containing protein [Candidatus Wallbacteria bacterium]